MINIRNSENIRRIVNVTSLEFHNSLYQESEVLKADGRKEDVRRRVGE